MPRPAVTVENFWNRVRVGKADECWPWFGPVSRGPRNKDPYGRVDAFGFKGVYVHRIAYWITNGGRMPFRKEGDALIIHSCDNTLCCNPRHLRIGTHQENMNDKVKRGRQHRFTSLGSPRAKLTEHDVREIRRKFDPENGATRKALALLYDVSISTISGVLYGRHYSDVG